MMNAFEILQLCVWVALHNPGYTLRYPKHDRFQLVINPSRPNSDLSQTSHCNIKGLSVSEVMRFENMITQVKFY